MASVDDVFVFPNIVGPVYPGSAIIVPRPPDAASTPIAAINDTWVLEWRRARRPTRATPQRREFPDWRDRDWGVITEQDYDNLDRRAVGHAVRGFTGLRLNPRQEINVLHMHRGIDAYLFSGTTA